MVEMTSQRFNHSTNLYEVRLENGDMLLITAKEMDLVYDEETLIFQSVNDKQYSPVFADKHEYNDDLVEVIGWQLV